MPLLGAIIPIMLIGAGLYFAVEWLRGESSKVASTVRGHEAPRAPWGRFRVTDRVIVLGLTGTGKTTLAAELAREADRALVFDPMESEAWNAHGFITIPLADLLEDPTPLEAARFHILALPNEHAPIEEEVETFVDLARVAGNLLAVMDEVGDYRAETERTLNRLARNGRHDGVASMYVSQVAVDIPLTVRRQATRIYSFKQIDPNDLDALERRTGPGWRAQAEAAWTRGEVATWTLPMFAQARLRESSPTLEPPKARA